MAFVSILQARLPFASGAVGPSLKPTKLGQTIIWRGKKYTAIKSGKKLIWNKGVALPSKKPSPTPTYPFVAEIDLAASEDVLEGDTLLFHSKNPDSRGKGFYISRKDGILRAFDNVCTHRQCLVSNGLPQLICSCHLALFNRFTGVPEGGPAKLPLKSYQVIEVTGRIVVTNLRENEFYIA